MFLADYTDPYAILELRIVCQTLQSGRVPYSLGGLMGKDEPYKDLDWDDPRDYPILNRWKRAQEMKLAVRLNTRDYLTPLYDKLRDGEDQETEQLIKAAEAHQKNLLSESQRLEEEAHILFEMRK